MPTTPLLSASEDQAAAMLLALAGARPVAKLAKVNTISDDGVSDDKLVDFDDLVRVWQEEQRGLLHPDQAEEESLPINENNKSTILAFDRSASSWGEWGNFFLQTKCVVVDVVRVRQRASTNDLLCRFDALIDPFPAVKYR